MKLIKILAFLGVILVMLAFLMRNFVPVPVDLVLVKYDSVSLAVVMVFTVAIGILIGFGVSLTTIMAAKAENRATRFKNRRLEEEINNLRNVAIEDEITTDDEEE